MSLVMVLGGVCLAAVLALGYALRRLWLAQGEERFEDNQARIDAAAREKADAEEARIDRLSDRSVYDELRSKYQRKDG